MNEEQSPFLIGTLVSGEHFVDREWPRDKLRSNFRSGINTVIISPRRWGKSSLIKQVAVDMARERNVRFAFVDLFHVRTEQDFLERTTEAVVKALGRTMEQRLADVKEFVRGVVPQVSFGMDPRSEFSLKLDLPDGRKSITSLLDLPERMATAKGVRLVLCIDEFQNIAQLPDPTGFQKMLRASWQHQRAVCHVIYGSKRHMMMDLFNKQSMPFYRFGDIMFLDKIKREDWIPFIQSRFASVRKTINAETCDHLVARMQDHSYHVQMLGHAAWLRTKGRTCTRAIVDTALQDLLNQHDALYHRLVDDITTPQLNYLRAFLNGVEQFTSKETLRRYDLGSSANVRRVTQALENKEILDLVGEETEWIDPLFKIWLEERFWGGRLRMV
ncbi:MAG: ATP-binding protein [Flavobacteriales bacterium]|nr:ATP-binding protein [Flavobacteriales bacterium]